MNIRHYRLDSFYDCDCNKLCGRLSLSAHADSQAIEQMRRIVWRHEVAGESRVLILSRPLGGRWFEVARMGTRRYG